MINRAGRTGIINFWGAKGSSKAYEIRDFLSRSVINYQWNEVASDEEARRLLGISGLGDVSLPLVELADGTRIYSATVRSIAEKLGFVEQPRQQEYDVSIYGAGPAGLSAAVYAASEGLKTVVIERHAVGGQAGSSSLIENYMGFPEGISGSELAERAREQAVKFGAEFLQMREGVNAEFRTGRIHVDLADGGSLIARTNVCATGVEWRKLGLPGEQQLLGRGLYYGAGASEAPLCDGKTVYVVGGGNSAGQAAMHFSAYARRVVMLVRGQQLADTLSQYLVEKVQNTSNIEVRTGTIVTELKGEDELNEIIVSHGSGSKEVLKASRLFVCIGGRPNTEWARNSKIARDESGYLITGRDLFNANGRPPECWQLEREPFFLETSIPGSFAVGDVRHNSIKRVASAAGEGAMSIAFVHRCLSAP